MKVRMEPITAIIISVLIGWGWYKVTDPGPICQEQEQIDGKTVFVPKPCADLIKQNEG